MSGPHAGVPAGLEALRAAWVEAVDAELAGAVALRHRIHAAPEVSGDEAAHRGGRRRRHRCRPRGGVRRDRAGCCGSARRAAAVAVRGELDALPLVEATEPPTPRSTARCTPVATTCTWPPSTALARAARALEAGGRTLPAGLVVVLQPREEVGPDGCDGRRRRGRSSRPTTCGAWSARTSSPLVPAGHVSCDPGPSTPPSTRSRSSSPAGAGTAPTRI